MASVFNKLVSNNKSSEIDAKINALMKDYEAQVKDVKRIVMLGTNGSGKSELFLRMQLGFGKSMTEKARRKKKCLIQCNIVKAFHVLIAKHSVLIKSKIIREEIGKSSIKIEFKMNDNINNINGNHEFCHIDNENKMNINNNTVDKNKKNNGNKNSSDGINSNDDLKEESKEMSMTSDHIGKTIIQLSKATDDGNDDDGNNNDGDDDGVYLPRYPTMESKQDENVNDASVIDAHNTSIINQQDLNISSNKTAVDIIENEYNSHYSDIKNCSRMPQYLVNAIKLLWNDKGIVETWEKRHYFYMYVLSFAVVYNIDCDLLLV